jgi:hypothetical protein
VGYPDYILLNGAGLLEKLYGGNGGGIPFLHYPYGEKDAGVSAIRAGERYFWNLCWW